MGATSNRERLIADSQFGGGALGPSGAGQYAPGFWYLGLSTTTPNDDGSGFTEPVGGSYARVTVINDSTKFAAAQTIEGETRKWNAAKLTFPNPTGTWGLILAYGWFLTLTGGTPEYWNLLDAPITVRNGNTPVEFDIQQMVMVFE